MAELPICVYYTADRSRCGGPEVGREAEHAPPRCVIAQFNRVRAGQTLCLHKDSPICMGGKRYLGFTHQVMPDFEYFLSCGIPGRLEGERYKKSPQIVREAMAAISTFDAPAPLAVFKRWDKLEQADEPQVVVFYATADVLAGLFTLSGFDETDPNAVIAPFGAGCAAIVQYPFLEGRAAAQGRRPRGVLGLFDPSARANVQPDLLTFAVPMAKFVSMVANMGESFLTTATWRTVQARIEQTGT